MNRKCRRRCTGAVYVQQRDLSGRTREHAGAALSAFCRDQARFRELGERLSNERGVGVHTLGQDRRGDFLAVVVAQGRHDVGGNRKLDALYRHIFSRAYVMLNSTIGYISYRDVGTPMVPEGSRMVKMGGPACARKIKFPRLKPCSPTAESTLSGFDRSRGTARGCLSLRSPVGQ